MNRIQILDCTLRDGGYINDFHFGKEGIRKILSLLTFAKIDIIECGFLEDCDYNPDYSLYNSVEQISQFLPKEHKHSMYVAMACYGEYSLENLSDYDGSSIDGIRVTFHYNEVEGTLEYCRKVIAKGYKVFIQPVGTTSYSDSQLLYLISRVNELNPYAFYLVDTLGLMFKDDVLRFINLIDKNLKSTIHFGFHSHNNLQLSYSNCQIIAEIPTDRIVSLDSSVYGMGRGAGNLNTELIANYLNQKEYRYDVEPILEIVDSIIVKIKEQFFWGYDVPHYLAAINGCHPNYASYLSNKNTLTVRSIGTILRMIPQEKRSLFNKDLAEEKYKEFQSNEIDDSKSISYLSSEIGGHNVLVLAPGPSIEDYQSRIRQTIKEENCIVVSIGFVPDFLEVDYVFLSNKKRYDTTFNPTGKDIKLIHTSNISFDNPDSLVVNYSSLIDSNDVIIDNAGMMFFNLLLKLCPKRVFVAGMDGYLVSDANYYQDRLAYKQDEEHMQQLNSSISHKLAEIMDSLCIEFITPTRYKI